MSRIEFAGMDIDKYKTPEFTQEKNKKYVNYGSDNLYPLYLVDLFNRSAKHNAILTGKQTYVYGSGLSIEGTWDLFVNANRFDSLTEIFGKCILDKLLYGGYALQIIWDRAGQNIAEIYHMDFSKIRSNVDNTEFFFSNDWADPRAKTKPYKVFNPDKKIGTQIYYYRDYRPATQTYPLPEYIGAIPYVECDVEIANYHRSNLHNEFFFGGILSFNNGEVSASCTAVIALFSPSALAEPIIACPLFRITVLTSLKSTLMAPATEITSAIPLAAVVKTSSA